MESIGEIGLQIIYAIQEIGWLKLPMQVITWFGSELFFLLFVSLLYWCVDTRLGIQVAAILLLSTTVNSALKLALASPRPYWYSTQVEVSEVEPSFGLPSAHAQNAVAVWGTIAQERRHWWIGCLAVLMIVPIGVSRIYLGVHFPVDVLAGWFVGIGILLLYNWLSQPIARWIQRYGFKQQVAIAIFTSLLLLLPSIMVVQIRDSWQMPSDWTQTLLQTSPDQFPQPLSLKTPISAAGTWFGFVTGVLWPIERRPFNPKGRLQKRLTRYLVGISVAIAIWAGLDALFPDGTTPIAYSLRYLRYTLIGGWIAAGAPIVFQLMRF
jgi:membrane-associated phospholipid phosphatase